MMRLMRLIVLMGLILAMGCSEDAERTERALVAVEAVPGTHSFVEVEPMAFTRAWTLPADFVTYDRLNSMFNTQTDLVDKNIDIFFTKDDKFTEDGLNYIQGLFLHGSNGKWLSSVEITNGDTYYLYGFIPYISSVSATIAPETSFSNGAVLTLSGLPTVTTNDVCVVVGAKNGKDDYQEQDDYSVTGLRRGDFAYTAGGPDENFVFLLFEHIYSALHFRFRVADDYAALRTIKLKRLQLLAYDNHATLMRRNARATITLRANNTGGSPITTVDFTSDESSTPMDRVDLYYNEQNPVELPSGRENDNYNYSEFFGGFVPMAVSSFTLRSTYDVYDKRGNLIRQDCTADNVLNMNDLFHLQSATMRGYKYLVNITVEPTYLYVLSDPDLDSPTMVISN